MTKKMYNKKIDIKNLDDVRLLLNVTLDVVTLIVQQKIGYQWNEVTIKKYTVTEETYNLEEMISDIMIEYAEKRNIQDYITNDLDKRDIKEIEIPEDS